MRLRSLLLSALVGVAMLLGSGDKANACHKCYTYSYCYYPCYYYCPVVCYPPKPPITKYAIYELKDCTYVAVPNNDAFASPADAIKARQTLEGTPANKDKIYNILTYQVYAP